MMRMLLLPAALVLLPVLLGRPWVCLLPERRWLRALACWPLGYFLALALFEMAAVPFAWLKGSFFVLAPVYTGLLAAAAGISCLVARRARKRNASGRKGAEAVSRLSYWEWLYLLAFLALAVFQTVRAFTWDTTLMNYDDSDYLGRAADAVTHGALLGINPGTGLAEPISLKRVMQGYLFFPAWLSWLSGVPVTAVARTAMAGTHVLMAYAVFSCMAMVLFPERENGLIFLALLSLLFMMGYYSHYSPTFRLLGPNWQGKAALAAVFCPFLFTLMMLRAGEAYDRRFGVLLLLFSLAAVSMTLFGAPVMMACTGLPVALSLIRKPRRWKNLLYILQASVFPAACAAVYFFLR